MQSVKPSLTIQGEENTADIVASLVLAARFTQDDVHNAYDEWGANCGPGAIAAIAGLSLAELRPHLGDFEVKRYINPNQMWAILRKLGLRWRMQRKAPGGLSWPTHGLARIQWEGPWTNAGVPIHVRYKHTHWVAVVGPKSEPFIFDMNCMSMGGWVPLKTWSQFVVPWTIENCVAPRATGRWHITHAVEVDWMTAFASKEAQHNEMGRRIQR